MGNPLTSTSLVPGTIFLEKRHGFIDTGNKDFPDVEVILHIGDGFFHVQVSHLNLNIVERFFVSDQMIF